MHIGICSYSTTIIASYVNCSFIFAVISVLSHIIYYNTGVHVSWQETDIMVPEGNNGDMMQADLCITLVERNSGLQREARFLLTFVSGTAGELI